MCYHFKNFCKLGLILKSGLIQKDYIFFQNNHVLWITFTRWFTVVINCRYRYHFLCIVCYVCATSTSDHIPSFHYFTGYGLVTWPSVVVWQAVHLLVATCCCLLAGTPAESSSRWSQPFVDKLFRREFAWLYSTNLSSSDEDARRNTSLVISTESVWMDVIGWYFQGATLQLSEQTLHWVEQFCRFLRASILRLRRDLPTTTDRHTCSPGTNRRSWQGRRQISRPSLVVVATMTLLRLTRRYRHCHARRCQRDWSSSPSCDLQSSLLPPAAPPLVYALLALRHFPFSLLYLFGVVDHDN